MKKSNLVWVDVSLPEHTAGGHLLGRMWYGGFLEKLVTKEERIGYPNNGGYHTLELRLSREDLITFVELVAASFSRPSDYLGVKELYLKISQSLVQRGEFPLPPLNLFVERN